MGLEFFNPESKRWGQSHCHARFVLLRVALEAGQGFVKIVEVEGADGKPDLLFSLDRTKIDSVGAPAVRDFVKLLQVRVWFFLFFLFLVENFSKLNFDWKFEVVFCRICLIYFIKFTNYENVRPTWICLIYVGRRFKPLKKYQCSQMEYRHDCGIERVNICNTIVALNV